jgi:histidine triad (HIT) family protein
MTKECIFCELYNEKKEIIYENSIFYARFDKFPISPGHAEVIPKKHLVSLADLTAEEWAELKPAIEDTIEVIEEANQSGRLKDVYLSFIANPYNDQSKIYCEQMLEHIGMGKAPDAYNHGVNDGEAAGRTIHHLHWHIIPRYKGDVENPRGGIRHIIPEKGYY